MEGQYVFIHTGWNWHKAVSLSEFRIFAMPHVTVGSTVVKSNNTMAKHPQMVVGNLLKNFNLIN